MKLIIDIPDHLYSVIKNKECTHNNVLTEAVLNGTPIPDNATFGDVFEKVFRPFKVVNKELLVDIYKTEGSFLNNRQWLVFSVNQWNASYQKSGK